MRLSVGAVTVRTRAPEVALHTPYTEIIRSKAGSALDWGAYVVLQSGNLVMVFLTLQNDPHSFTPS